VLVSSGSNGCSRKKILDVIESIDEAPTIVTGADFDFLYDSTEPVPANPDFLDDVVVFDNNVQ